MCICKMTLMFKCTCSNICITCVCAVICQYCDEYCCHYFGCSQYCYSYCFFVSMCVCMYTHIYIYTCVYTYTYLCVVCDYNRSMIQINRFHSLLFLPLPVIPIFKGNDKKHHKEIIGNVKRIPNMSWSYSANSWICQTVGFSM